MKSATYSIQTVRPDAIFIIDLNTGKSITNDAENVVRKINKSYPGRRIIYRDTDGKWDELVHKEGEFITFKEYSEEKEKEKKEEKINS